MIHLMKLLNLGACILNLLMLVTVAAIGSWKLGIFFMFTIFLNVMSYFILDAVDN